MHRPYLIKAHPWDSVVDFFAGFASVNPECEPMHRFVSQVASSRHSQDLFPLTSMHTLILSRTPEFESNHKVLRVDFDCTRQQFHFEYVTRDREEPGSGGETWTKKCGATEGFGAFERFIALKKWSV